MRNIVFIGMPGCGKTTISKLTAEALVRKWFDTDREIETAEQMSIPEIFSQKGEEYFRKLETACLNRLMPQEEIVISAGGGAVLRNAEILEKQALVIYVKRDIENIAESLEDGTRPLLKKKADLYRLYDERREIYEKLCGIMVYNNKGIEDCVNDLLSRINKYENTDNQWP